MNARTWLLVAFAAWLALTTAAFVAFGTTAPEDSGFTRGLNRPEALAPWLAGAVVAALVALVAFRRMDPPRGGLAALMGYAPLALMLAAFIGGIAVALIFNTAPGAVEPLPTTPTAVPSVG